MGFDAYYFRGRESSLIIKALQEDRIILTRRKRLAEEKSVKKVIIENDKLKDQIREVEEKLGIKFNLDNLFSRCSECNAEVVKVDKELVKNKVPEYVYQTQEEFYKCPKCKKIFWQGTHWDLARKFFEELKR